MLEFEAGQIPLIVVVTLMGFSIMRWLHKKQEETLKKSSIPLMKRRNR